MASLDHPRSGDGRYIGAPPTVTSAEAASETADITAARTRVERSNGVIHVVDKVLLPK